MKEQDQVASIGAAPGSFWLWSLRAVGVVGLLISAYLTAVSAFEGVQPLGCGADSSCSRVLGSSWSKLAGIIPVSLPAILVYALAVSASVFLGAETTGRQRRLGWLILSLAAVVLVGAAAWFGALQVLVIGSFCAWCFGAHLCGVAFALLVLARAPFRWRAEGRNVEGVVTASAAAGVVTVGLLAVAAVALGQVFIKPIGQIGYGEQGAGPVNLAPVHGRDASYARMASPRGAGERKRRVTLYDGQIQLELPLPMLGSMDAPHVIIELFDYCCSHCRDMHKRIESARKRYDGELAIVTLPNPLDAKCNPHVVKTHAAFVEACELAHLALAVWHARPQAFEQMHEHLFLGTKAPTTATARAYAVGLVGAEPLRLAMAEPWITDQIRKDVELHRGSSGGKKQNKVLPKLIHAKGMVTGVPKVDQFFKYLEEQVGLTPPPAAAPESAGPQP
jgi:uncharacterized membrane protein